MLAHPASLDQTNQLLFIFLLKVIYSEDLRDPNLTAFHINQPFTVDFFVIKHVI